MAKKIEAPKEVVRYRVLGIQPDPINKGKTIIPSSVRIPAEDYVLIDKESDVWGEISYTKGKIQGKDTNGNTKMLDKLGDILFLKEGAGLIVIAPKDKAKVELYRYLEQCNWNASNPNRNTEILPLFERLDYKKIAEKANAKSKMKFNAMNMAMNTPLEEMSALTHSLGIDVKNRDEALVRADLLAQAELKPQLFLQDESIPTPVVDDLIGDNIKKGIEIGAIEYLASDDKRSWADEDGKVFYEVPLNKKDHVKALADYYMTKKGEKMYDQLLEVIK